MARIGRAGRISAVTSIGPVLGPHDPTVIGAAFIPPPVRVRPAEGLTKQRRSTVSALYAPSIISVTPATLDQQTIQTTLIAVRRRLRQQRYQLTDCKLQPPTVVALSPFAPISTNLAAGLTTNQRRAQKRFPLQGWDGVTQLTNGLTVLHCQKTASIGDCYVTQSWSSFSASPDVWATTVIAFDQNVINVEDNIFSVTGNQAVFVNSTGWHAGTGGNYLVPPQPNRWYLVELHSTATQVELYIDGALAATGTTARGGALESTVGFFASGTGPMETWSQYLRLGTTRGGSEILFRDFRTHNTLDDGWTNIHIANPANGGVLSTIPMTQTPMGGPNQTCVGGMVRRFLGPRPPITVDQVLAPPIAPKPVSIPQAVVRRQQAQQRAPKSLLFPVPSFAQPPPLPYAVRVTLAAKHPRSMVSALYAPTVVSTGDVFYGPSVTLVGARPRTTASVLSPPIGSVSVLTYDQTTISTSLASTRPRRKSASVSQPTVLQTFSASLPHLVATRPRATQVTLSPPTVIRVASVEQREQTITIELARVRPRRTTGHVSAPAVLQVFQSGEPKLVQTRPRATLWTLSPPTVVSRSDVFYGPHVTVVRSRPRPTVAMVAAPAVLQTFQSGTPHLVQTRPRATQVTLSPPTVTRVPSVEQAEQTIRVQLSRIRPRPTHARVSAPTVLSVFDGPKVSTIRTRPRPTIHEIAPPTVVRVPAVEQQQQTIRVLTVRTRPRATQALLSPPTTLQTFSGPLVRLVQIRPRPTATLLAPPTTLQTFAAAVEERLVVQMAPERPRYAPHSKLSPPTVLQTFDASRAHLVATRPRHVSSVVRPPAVVSQPPVINYRTAVTVVRTRPRATSVALQPPTVVVAAQIYYGPRTTLVRARPQPTTTLLSPPTVLQTFASGGVHLAQTRPRPTAAVVFAPTVLQTFVAEVVEDVIATRVPEERPRRLTHSRLYSPTVIRVPSVEQAQQTIRVSLTRTRPRPTHARVSAPTVLAVFGGPDVALSRIRPPRTRVAVEPPTVLQVFYGPTVALATIRPPKTRSVLQPPFFYAQTSTIETKLVSVESRRVSDQQRAPHSRLYPPTVLATFRGPVEEQVTIGTLIERPRHAPHSFLRPPTVVRVPSVEQREQTITTRLVSTRPRPTAKTLRPPTVVSRPPVGYIVTALAAVRTRAEQKRHYPLPGFTQRIVRETGSAAGINMSLRDPFLGPRPPQIVDPLPNQRQQTLTVVLDAVRTRGEQKRHYPLPGFRQRIVRETGSTVTCQMRDPLLGPRPPVIVDPLPNQQQQTIRATCVAVRTRYEQKLHGPHSSLDPPTVIDRTTFEGAKVTLTRTRPPVTTLALSPAVVIRVPAVEQSLRTIRVSLTRTRPRPTIHTVEPPTALRTFGGPAVHLVATRPRPTRVVVRPPSVLQTFSGPQVHLVSTRPRPTVATLNAPAVIDRFFAEPVSVTLTRARPRPTTTVVSAPTALRTFETGRPHLVTTRPRPTQATIGAPVVSVPAVEQALRSIHVHLARIRPAQTRSELRRPTSTSTFSGPTVHTVRTRPRHTAAALRPPTVVAAQALTYAQSTISVTLAPPPDLVRGTTTRLPGPPLVVTPRMGFTTGDDVPATAVEGFDGGGSYVASETVPASAVESDQIAGVDSVIEDVPATAVEGGPEEAFD